MRDSSELFSWLCLPTTEKSPWEGHGTRAAVLTGLNSLLLCSTRTQRGSSERGKSSCNTTNLDLHNLAYTFKIYQDQPVSLFHYYNLRGTLDAWDGVRFWMVVISPLCHVIPLVVLCHFFLNGSIWMICTNPTNKEFILCPILQTDFVVVVVFVYFTLSLL